jgi:hypothetical protein
MRLNVRREPIVKIRQKVARPIAGIFFECRDEFERQSTIGADSPLQALL